VPTSDSERKGL